MTLNDILNDTPKEDDVELCALFKDWEARGLIGCSNMEYHVLLTLASIPNVVNILELGPGKGASTEVMLMALRRKNNGHLTTVDVLPESELVLLTDRSRFTRFGMNTNTFFTQNMQKYDLIFIDADHTDAQSWKDIDNALKVLNPGGFVAAHDLWFNGHKDRTDISRHVASLSAAYGKKYKFVDKWGYGLGVIYE